jgi:proline iminopeptidase
VPKSAVPKIAVPKSAVPDSGLLDVGDGQQVYWESWGDPAATALLNVHGGPGAGAPTRPPTTIDLSRFRLIRFDQRGCGRSIPHAADPGVDMSVNTTGRLIADMERLREHLGIDSWLLHGGSWGTTLSLAYAQAHPRRVLGMVLVSVTTTRRSEIDWLYRGVGRFFPREWEDFVAGVPEVAFDGDIMPVLAAYAARMADRDPAVRDAAALAWVTWEDAVISAESNGSPGAYSSRTGAARNAFVRICSHYFSNAAWLAEGQLIRDAGRLAGIPGVLIHGRFDLGGPLVTPWQLAGAWPDARLIVVEDSGHTGSDSMRRQVAGALAGFAGS